MKSNILRENMKRFGTKNLSEQKNELETAAEPVAPKAEEKVDVEKTFVFKGNKGITSSGKPFTNPPYSVDFQIVSRPQIDATGKQIGIDTMVKADGKVIMTLGVGTGMQRNILNFYKTRIPSPLKRDPRVTEFLLGMLGMEKKVDIKKTRSLFLKNGLAVMQNPGNSAVDIYKGDAPSKLYQVM